MNRRLGQVALVALAVLLSLAGVAAVLLAIWTDDDRWAATGFITLGAAVLAAGGAAFLGLEP